MSMSTPLLGDLLYYGGVEWLNISDFLGKIKKGLELHAMCFVFKSAVVFLCKERLRQKKKLMVNHDKSSKMKIEASHCTLFLLYRVDQVKVHPMRWKSYATKC